MIFISITCFPEWKEIWREFLLLWKKVKIVFGLFCNEPSERQWAPLSVRGSHWAPSPGFILNISASSHSSFDLRLWASITFLTLLCASVSEIPRYCCFAVLHFGSWKFAWEGLFFFGYLGKPVLEMFGGNI